MNTFFHEGSIPGMKSQFHWLLRHRMGSLWTEVSKNDYNAMGEWIYKYSKGRFTQVLPKTTPNFALTLAAGFNFKGKWHQPLEALPVTTETFELSPTAKIDLPMYKVTSKVSYYKDAERGFHLIGIPFKVSKP